MTNPVDEERPNAVIDELWKMYEARVIKARNALGQPMDVFEAALQEADAARARVTAAIRQEERSRYEGLLAAASKPHHLSICEWVEYPGDGDVRDDCSEYATWVFHDYESSYWLCEKHANQPPYWWNADEDGAWSTSSEPDAGAIALVAALADTPAEAREDAE